MTRIEGSTRYIVSDLSVQALDRDGRRHECNRGSLLPGHLADHELKRLLSNGSIRPVVVDDVATPHGVPKSVELMRAHHHAPGLVSAARVDLPGCACTTAWPFGEV